MKSEFDSLLKDVTDELKSVVKTETVIGEMFTLGEFTCVPIIRIGLGFGGGAGSGEDSKKGQGGGGGAGAGIGMEPLGFLVTRGDSIQILDLAHRGALGGSLGGALEKMPDLLTKYMESKSTSTASASQDS